jgi:hypothetical protein
MKAIMNAALEKTIPIAWYEPERFPEKQELATCFVLRFSNRLVGVTAKHVYCAYLKAKRCAERHGREFVCQLGNASFIDIEARRAQDKLLDLLFFLSIVLILDIFQRGPSTAAGGGRRKAMKSVFISALQGSPESYSVMIRQGR